MPEYLPIKLDYLVNNLRCIMKMILQWITLLNTQVNCNKNSPKREEHDHLEFQHLLQDLMDQDVPNYSKLIHQVLVPNGRQHPWGRVQNK